MTRTRKPKRPETLRAIAYVRVSTVGQVESGLSLEAQRSTLAAEVQRRGWDLLDVAEDDGRSGSTTTKRPGLLAALEMLDSGEADVLIATKVDRVSRSTLDFANLVDRSDRHGWQLVTLDVPLDPTTPIGKATRSMLATFAQLERDFASQRTREALAVKAEQGVRLGRPTSVPDYVVARVVRLRDSGMTWAAVADELNEQQVPGGQGGRWWPATASRIYANATKN